MGTHLVREGSSEVTHAGVSSLFAGPFVQCDNASLLAAATREDIVWVVKSDGCEESV